MPLPNIFHSNLFRLPAKWLAGAERPTTPEDIAQKGRRRHEVTLAGFVFLGITLFVLLSAIETGTNTLYLAFGLLFGGLIVSGLLSWVSLRHLDIKRLMSDHVVAGEPAEIQYLLTNKKRRWPCFAIRITEVKASSALAQVPDGYCLHIPAGGTAMVTTRLVAARRGVIELSDIRVTCAFPFGFLNHAIHLRAPEQLVVYPHIGVLNRHLALRYREAIESGAMTANIRGGNDEFYGLREYRSGDNIRSIHWRSTARTNQLMIREMAANAPPQVIIVLNLRTIRHILDTDLRSIVVERAIELAASLICYGFVENFAVALAIAGVDTESPPVPLMGREARAHLLRRLAILDADKVDPRGTLAIPNRLVGRAEWIIVTPNQSDPIRDLLPSSPATSHTLLPLDAPGAENWLQFLTGQATQRILRDQSA
jgi:uncharacterized protein (DUF58 family)